MPTPKEQALRIALTQSLKKNEVYRKALEEILTQFKRVDPLYSKDRQVIELAEEALKEK